jgi:ABC-type nitrate/sulfonate/bicarbonate transport system substrate-binding protein
MFKACLSAVIIYFVFALPPPSHAQNIRISYAGTSGQNVPLWVTQEAGLFTKHGLKSELILFSGGSTNVQALLANEIIIANAGGPPVIQARLQGAEVIMIAAPYNFIPYSFVVHKDIRAPSDLKGKRIAIARLGGVTELGARLVFEKVGLGPKDMTFVQAGPDSARIAALQSGVVAATVISPPGLFVATSLGHRVLIDLSDLGVRYPMGIMATARSNLAQNRSVLKRFLMAFIEGLHLYAQKKDFALSVMRKYTKFGDLEGLSKSHDYFVKNMVLVPFTDPGVIKDALAVDGKAGIRKVEEFYDNSLLQEIVNEGFVDKVSK